METYLLKTIACMAIFLAFYKLLLEKENMHVFKRFYLIGTLIASLIIPNLVFTEYIESTIENEQIANAIVTNSVLDGNSPISVNVINTPILLISTYLIGVMIFGYRFGKNLFKIIKQIRTNTKIKSGNVTHVLTKKEIIPHTFFNYIFFNKIKFESNEIPLEVILHEETHVTQIHSLDVLFIEILQTVLWFNPLLYFFNKAIKLNHEFLADSAVLQKKINPSLYQNTLLSYLSPDSSTKYKSTLTNAINYSSIKKRFTVMKSQTSKKAILIRSLLLLPLLGVMLLSFSSTNTVYQNQHLNTTISSNEGATKKQVEEYNSLAKKYNAIIKSDNVKIHITDVNRMSYLYSITTKDQRESAEPYPTIPPMPEAPEPESAQAVKGGWTVSGTVKPNSRGNDFSSLPPPAPVIAVHIDKKEYSKKLRAAITNYYKNVEAYEEKLQAYRKNKKGDLKNLHKSFQKIMSLYNEYYVLAHRENKFVQPAIPNNTVLTPPPPPEPKSPLDYVIDMAKKGAIFYYEGKKIPSNQAIKLIKENKNLNIDSRSTKDSEATVKISKYPIKTN